MKVNKVITGVDLGEPGLPTSYFVLEGTPHEAASFIGQVFVDSVSMQDFIDWLHPMNQAHNVLLLQLDGKRAYVYPLVNVDTAKKSSIIKLELKGRYAFYEIDELVRDFAELVEKDPKLAKRLA
jgi:hypothetical protein